MIYLATAYSHDDFAIRIARYEAAVNTTGMLVSVGRRHVFSPIVHCHPLACRFPLPYQFTYWEQYDTHMLRNAEMILVATNIPGWQESKGVNAEISLAEKLSVPKRFLWKEDLLIPGDILHTFDFHHQPPAE